MASEQPTRTAESTDELCAPEALTLAEQREYWQGLAHELFALVKRYASECGECLGDGVVGFTDQCGNPMQKACVDCADIRALVAKAEGRS